MLGGEQGQETTFDRPILSVSELTLRIKQALESRIGHVWVSGEISGFKKHSESGHCYFRLKDEAALLKAVMFRFQARGLKFKPEDGLEVIAFGRISAYAKSGDYQIHVEHMQPKGMGVLQLRFEQLKKKLAAEGLFDADRKKKIPFLPKAIGVVTSAQGAALQDLVKTIHKRFPARVFVHDVRVQGEGAAKEISRAIRQFPKLAPEAEVIIVGRGGGSIEDLWAFNEETVVRAIAASRIPIVSAVGHETDFTLADFAADERAKTPTDAGTIVVPVLNDLNVSLSTAGERLISLMREKVEYASMTIDRYRDSYGLRSIEKVGTTFGEKIAQLRARADRALDGGMRERRESVTALQERRVLRDPEQAVVLFRDRLRHVATSTAFSLPTRNIGVERRRLSEFTDRLRAQAASTLRRQRQRLIAIEQQLSELDPKKVLERGYSITELNGKIVLDADQVPSGSEIQTHLHKGKLRSITRR